MKKIIIVPLLIICLFFIIQKAEAKVWTKDLISKVTLDSGYKFSLCTIDMKYDRTGQADNILSAVEKDFEANPNSYPCNKQAQEDILFANITLNFNQANGGGKEQDKMVEFQNKLYSINSYGSVFDDSFVDTNKTYADIAAFDWFSTLPGIHGIRVGELYNTDPTTKGEILPNSPFLIIHDPATGKFTSALFIFNNAIYKLSSIISQVTTPTTLIDYTQPTSNQPSASPSTSSQ